MTLDADNMVVRKCLQTIQKNSNDRALLQCFEVRVEQNPGSLQWRAMILIWDS